MVKNRFKKIYDNLDIIMLSVLMLLFLIFIKNEKVLQIIKIVSNIFIVIYIYIRCIKGKHVQIFNTKLDYFILLLVISPLIPIIFNTYLSFSETVKEFLDYVTLFNFYILAKEIFKRNKKNELIFRNLIIAFAVIGILFGIENLSTNFIFKILKLDNFTNGEDRLVSFFGNPNLFAGFLSLVFFINTNEILNSKNIKTKTFYSTINTIIMLGILLTYSKTVFVIFSLILIIFLVKIRKHEEFQYIVKNIIVSVSLAVIYAFVFQKLLNLEYYISVWILTFAFIEVSFILNFLIKKKINISKRRGLIAVITLVLLSGIFVTIGLNIKTDYIISSTSTSAVYKAKIIKNIPLKENTTLKFNMFARVFKENNIEDMFKIKVIQRKNNSLEEVKSDIIKFGNFSGEKEINIHIAPDITELKIEFWIKNIEIPTEWVIHNLLINNEEYILEYKFLPTKLVEKLKDININYRTLEERLQFVKDGVKILSNNFLTGLGGDAWNLKYKEVQGYEYESSDIHNYYLRVWLQFGIIGILSIIFILLYILKINNEEKVGIKYGIIVLLLHSGMEVDLSYFSIKLILFILIAMLINKKDYIKYKKKFYISNILTICLSLIAVILLLKPDIYSPKLIVEEIEESNERIGKNTEQYKNNCKKLVELCNSVLKKERDSISKIDYEFKLVKYSQISSHTNFEKIIETYYNEMKKFNSPYTFDKKLIISKNENITKLIKMLEQNDNGSYYIWMSKLAKLNIDEFAQTRQTLLNSINQTNTEYEYFWEYRTLIENLEYSNKIYSTYFSGAAIISNSNIDIEELNKKLDSVLIEDINTEEIMLYHTHTTEAYSSNEYIETETNKTFNENFNVISVGEKLKEQLIKKGFKVNHIKKYNDINGVEKAYQNSLETLNNSIATTDRIIFDIHRDSGTIVNDDFEIDSKKCAKLRFVIGLENENWINNLKWAIELQRKSYEMYPGLFEPILILDGKYNQEISDFATLLEVGTDENTIDEAKNSMEFFSNVLYEYLNNEV